MRSWFESYNELANGVQKCLDVEMPPLDLTGLQQIARGPLRQVIPPQTDIPVTPQYRFMIPATRTTK